MHAPAIVTDEPDRVQALLASLDRVGNREAVALARELVTAVLALHGAGLRELLELVKEAADQPADALLPRFAANPAVAALLLLHDLHPDDLATRARRIVDHLRPRLAVRGVRTDLEDVRDGVISIAVSPSGQQVRRPDAETLRTIIQTAVARHAPDAELLIDGLAATAASTDAYVPVATIVRRRETTA